MRGCQLQNMLTVYQKAHGAAMSLLIHFEHWRYFVFNTGYSTTLQSRDICSIFLNHLYSFCIIFNKSFNEH